MGNKFKLILALFFIGLFIVSFLSTKSKYPRPTESYYINDYADALSLATRASIKNEGDRLYNVSLDEVDGGSQVVVATFKVDQKDDIADYDKTEIYRQWKIGQDDMGVLILLFFTENNQNELELEMTQIEVGYRMEPYLTPAELGQMIDTSIGNDEYNWYLDIAVMNLFYQILEEIYVGVYEYPSFNYDMDAYYDYILNYTGSDEISISPMTLLFYLFSSFSSFQDKIWTFLPYGLFFLFSGGFIVRKGAGGRSGGMGVRR